MFKQQASIITMLVGLLLFTHPASGGLVTTLKVDVTPETDSFLYSYQLSNLPNSDLSAISLDIQTGATANLQSILAPTGWNVLYSPGDTTVSFQSPDSLYDLFPGSSFSYSFLSYLAPSLGDYVILGIDESSAAFEFVTGQIDTPTAAVPEPSTLVHFFCAMLVGLLAITRFHLSLLRSKRQSPVYLQV